MNTNRIRATALPDRRRKGEPPTLAAYEALGRVMDFGASVELRGDEVDVAFGAQRDRWREIGVLAMTYAREWRDILTADGTRH